MVVKKPSRGKIRVEFEMDPEEVRELIEAGSKAPVSLSDAELKTLIEKGTIKASDYLDEGQMAVAVAALPSWISKAVNKTVDKLHNPKVQKAAISGVVATVSTAERKSAEDRPEE